MWHAPDGDPVATLWRLAMDQDRISCSIYRHGGGFQLRLESPLSVILAEPFDLQPRMIARTQTLRASLTRRGWRDIAES